jgi:lipid-binding SYLF domain-containing protein
MLPMTTWFRAAVVGVAFLTSAGLGQVVHAGSAAELDRKAASAEKNLLASHEAARTLAKEARAILVFPNIVKGGFMFGGQFGDGALRRDGHAVGYYRSVAAS